MASLWESRRGRFVRWLMGFVREVVWWCAA